MSEAWGLVTSDHPDPVLRAIGFLHEQLNPVLLSDGLSQGDADQVLAEVTHALCAAVKKSAPHERGDTAACFARRCIGAYHHDDGHKTH